MSNLIFSVKKLDRKKLANMSRSLLCEMIPLSKLRKEATKQARTKELAIKYEKKNKIKLCRLKDKSNGHHILSKKHLIKLILSGQPRTRNKSRVKSKSKRIKSKCKSLKKNIQKVDNIIRNLSKSKKLSVNRKRLTYSKLKRKLKKEYNMHNC